jgi:hypothetical protein
MSKIDVSDNVYYLCIAVLIAILLYSVPVALTRMTNEHERAMIEKGYEKRIVEGSSSPQWRKVNAPVESEERK